MTPHNTQPNVLLIVVDTARADVVTEMMDRGELPNLEDLASSGRRYTRAISQSPWTLPSHASIFTGQYPSDHRAHAGTKSFDPDRATLAEHLGDAGYNTVGISGNIWISPEFGFDRGFDDFSMKFERFWNGSNLSGVSKADSKREMAGAFLDSVSPRTLLPTVANGVYTKALAGRTDKGAANTTRRTKRWFARHSDDPDPFFYFINYLEPHLKYEPQRRYAEPFLPDDITYDEAIAIEQQPWEFVTGNVEYTEEEFEALRALYRGELAYIDEQIGTLVAALEAEGIRDETAIVVVGDHGENIGDHGLMDHQYCLNQSLVHVPLIVDCPEHPPAEISDPVETRDLFPTVLDLAGVDPDGESAASANSLLDDCGRKYACSEYLAPQPSMESLHEQVTGPVADESALDRTLRAIQGDRWKLIEGSDRSIELYDVNDDPHETTDHSQDSSDTANALQSEADRRGLSITYRESSDSDASEATKARLADLGYI